VPTSAGLGLGTFKLNFTNETVCKKILKNNYGFSAVNISLTKIDTKYLCKPFFF
jgi:hypothetical protein